MPGRGRVAGDRPFEHVEAAVEHIKSDEGARLIGVEHLYLMPRNPIDLPEGVSVRCNIIDVEADPDKIEFGMPVEMVTSKVREDKEGNDVIAFFFRPAS